MNKYKPVRQGDIMPVYQKPLTGQQLEDYATLIKEIKPDDGDGLSSWLVEFLDETGNYYQRTINAILD